MKKLLIICTMSIFPSLVWAQMKKDSSLLSPVEVIATKAGEKTPIAKTEIKASEIRKMNTGRDIPFILNETPSVTANSDAGNGIGYTGIRIRGTDASRINVTLNNIPYNDAESQATYLVDIPDIISSASSIQIQRGVGTSTNGAGAFGASINISTNEIKKEKRLEVENTIGSFRTSKKSLNINSGLFKNHFTLDARLSSIYSDGYIDRAFSDLSSFYTSLAYTHHQSSLRLNVFSGKEKTYQAWYGVREDILDSNRTYNPAGSERASGPYGNQTDNYRQTHYQLFYNQTIHKNWQGSLATFITRGKGYYEEYKADQAFDAYGIQSNSTGDLIRRLWLDNYYYGNLLSLQYKHQHDQCIIGAGWTAYDGKHYGKIVWADTDSHYSSTNRYYDLTAFKKDINLFAKWERSWKGRWSSYLDIQARTVFYDINGFRYNPDIIINNQYTFLNPKIGISYSFGKNSAFISMAKAGKEPNRDDLESAKYEAPKPEHLYDLELGFKGRVDLLEYTFNGYWMSYQDQLILTGKINDVGAFTRTNVPKSNRTGLEAAFVYSPFKYLSLRGNASFSVNKIKEYKEYVFDYDSMLQKGMLYKNTDIAFSPTWIAFGGIEIKPWKNMEIFLSGKYTGDQYLDNTMNESRKIKSYFVQDIRLQYNMNIGKQGYAHMFVQANNIFSEKYEANGYTFSYIYGGALNTENYYYPMAPLNWLIGLRCGIH